MNNLGDKIMRGIAVIVTMELMFTFGYLIYVFAKWEIWR